MENSARSIIHTLVYADIFDFPLTHEELWRYLLVERESVSYTQFQKTLKKLPPQVIKKDNFYLLQEREEIVEKRLSRQKNTASKMDLAKKTADMLFRIPTVQFIGISGALAMGNSDEDDDIDLFVIAKKNSVWITRLVSLFCLQVKGVRRKRSEKRAKNKICLNMIQSEQSLLVPEEKRDIYTAHEVVQLVPILERNNLFQRFLLENSWVENFLPNALSGLRTKEQKKSGFSIAAYILVFVEPLARAMQLWYMRDHKTTEEVSKSSLAFHPYDWRKRALKEYHEKIEFLDKNEAKIT